jgi:ankyrin repeat protein
LRVFNSYRKYINMRYFFATLFCFSALFLQAQKNIFLDRSYWKSNPDSKKVQADIEKGNNPAESNSNGFDPTVFAIIEQAPNETVEFLLDQKGNGVNKITHDQRTYIFWAAYKGNTELMEYLLKMGAKTNLRDDKGFTPLSFAAANGQTNTKVYDICLREGANLKKDLDLEGANALLLAAPFDTDFSLINYFISKGLDLRSTDANGDTAFNYAARAGNIELLKKLVEKGVKYNDNAIIMASKGTRSHTNTLELYNYLDGLKIKPTALGKNGENVLHAIVTKEKQTGIITYFLSKGVDINQADNDGNTVFMNAASANSDADIIRMLISKVKDINHLNKNGISALDLAVKNNSAEIVQILLDNNANFNLTDTNGDNVIYYLVQSYNPQKKEVFDSKLKMLEGKGLKLNSQQKNGNTLYHMAVAKNNLSLMKFIDNLGIDINAKNNEGLTALHKAALVSQDDVILKHLLSKGAKKEIKTDFKETAYDIASENEALKKNKVSIDFLN